MKKKPAAASKSKSDNSAIGVPEADSPSDSQDLSKNPEGGLAAASIVAKPDTKMVGLHRFWSNPILDDTSQNDNQDVHQGGRKRMRSKTHDDQPPPAAPPATKKQKAETEQKAKGEAAQSSKSKKRSLDEPASSTQTEAVKKAKSGGKAAEAEKTPPKPAPDSETSVIEVATQVATQGSAEKRCFFCNEAESQSVKAFQVNSKKAGTYKCQKCTSSRTYFYHSGDFPDIIKLTEEDRWKFFQSCKDATKDKQLEMIRSLKTSNIDNKIHETGYLGHFYPESVLTKKGYDVERIKNNSAPEDMFEDKKLLILRTSEGR